MESGSLIDLDITGVAHGGVFVARHEGRVIFVPDTLPGERVRVRLSDVRKSSFWRGEVIEVLDAAPERVPHVWSAADVSRAPEERAGGADFGHIRLDHQRELKKTILRDALQRTAKLDLPITMSVALPSYSATGELVAESPDGTGWRTRVSLHVDEAGRIGPYAARSHRVIEVDDLPLATEAIARAAGRRRVADPGRLDFVEPSDGHVRVVAGPERTRAPRRGGAKVAPSTPETVIQRVLGRDFRVDVDGFWQVHRLAAHSLSRAVYDALDIVAPGGGDPDAWHLDLYGGVGLLAAAIADHAGPSARVTTVEANARATEHAGENLSEWVGARAETGKVDRWLTALTASASASERGRLERGVVVLDPPRAGAGREVVESVAGLRPAHVVYVACDPVALARDLATFRDLGYETSSVDGFDLFPHSHHIEAVAVLSR